MTLSGSIRKLSLQRHFSGWSGSYTGFWVDVTYDSDTQIYTWRTNGQIVTSDEWQPRQPDLGPPFCFGFRKAYMLLDDAPCNWHDSYVCEKQA